MIAATPIHPPKAVRPAVVPDYDVVVAGAGPSGSAAALLMAQQGLNVGVLEARGVVPSRGNVIQLTQPSLDTLDAVGAADKLRGAWPDRPEHVGRHHALSSIESAMRSKFEAAGVSATYDAPVAGVRELDDHVAISVGDATAGAQRLVTARYVVNATGGRLGNNVIDRADGASEDISPLQASDSTTLVIVPHPFVGDTDEGATIRRGTITNTETGKAQKIKFNLMQNPRDGAVAVTRPPQWLNDADDATLKSVFSEMQLGPAEQADAIDGAAPAPPSPNGEPIIVHHKHQLAPSARAGRVVSLGDAVSRVHPKTGFGTNAGIEDARLAAASIVQALRDPASAEDALQSYGKQTMQRHTDWLAHSVEAHGGGLDKATATHAGAGEIIAAWTTQREHTEAPPESI